MPRITETRSATRIEAMRRRRPRFRDERITMAHGAGGKASRALVEGLIVRCWRNPALEQLGDAALLTVGGARLAFTTDSFVVTPDPLPRRRRSASWPSTGRSTTSPSPGRARWPCPPR